MNFHSYPPFAANWTSQGPGLLQKLETIRSKMLAHGVDKPIIVTETGWHSASVPDYPSSPELQARYVAALFTQGMAGDAPIVIWWMLLEPGGHYWDCGLLDSNLSPKPSYRAYQTLVAELGTARFERVLTVEETGASDMEAYRFVDYALNRTVYVAWLDPLDTDNARPLSLAAPQATARDIYGNSRVVSDGDDGVLDGRVTILVSGQPAYVEVSGAAGAPAALPTTKKGVSGGDCDVAIAVGAAYLYAWGSDPPVCAGLEAIPMIWDEATWEQIKAGAQRVGGNSVYLMGFNEPDVPTQANISPGVATTLWREIEQAFPEKRLVAPAPVHWFSSDGDGLWWLHEWRASYIAQFGDEPRIDVLACHCYAETADECEAVTTAYIEHAQEWDVPEVWVTEFAVGWNLDPDVGVAHSREFIAWMERQPAVTRYFWFITTLNSDGPEWWRKVSPALADFDTHELTVYGQMYRDF